MRSSRAALQTHVETLARVPRPAGSPELRAAREYVVAHLNGYGWTTCEEEFAAPHEVSEMLNGVNVVARWGHSEGVKRPVFCVGAHIDSRDETPGADDNASGVAALLEIARLWSQSPPESQMVDLELVVFDLEEWGMLGGAFHAGKCRQRDYETVGMVALEMLGYVDRDEGSQQLPRGLAGLYPTVGNFIAVIGNQVSGSLIKAFETGLKEVQGLPVETLQVPQNGTLLQATRLSDHSPFWDAGYPALMLTDTSFLRNPHYHQPTDKPETLDYDFLEQVTSGSWLAVREIVRNGLRS